MSSPDQDVLEERDPTIESLASTAEWSIAAGASLLALSFHAIFFMKAGPLWRDEINSVQLAALPDLGALWTNLQFDSFPPGWLLTLHYWIALFSPESETGFRILGLLTGLTLLVVVWLAGRDMAGRPPIVAITLLLLSASVIRFGDSIRGYGLGMIGAVVCIWTLHRFAIRGDLRSFIVAAVASVLSVQFLYYNAVTVFAACIAAAIVALAHRSLRRAATAMGIGAIAASSLLPSLSTIRSASSWNDLVRYDIDIRWLHYMWRSTLENSGNGIVAVWYVMLAAALASSAITLRRVVAKQTVDDTSVFHSVVFVVSTATYLVFLLTLSYITAPWYYLAFIVIQALTIDVLLGRSLPPRARLLTVATLFIAILVSFGATRSFVTARATNVDLAAEILEKEAKPQDLIVVTPWEIGITFARSYDAPTPWETVPPLGPLRWHRYDLFMESLDEPELTVALFDRIRSTIQSGNRVFVVANVTRQEPPGIREPEARVPEQVLPAMTLFRALDRAGYAFRELTPLEPATEYETARLLQIVPRG